MRGISLGEKLVLYVILLGIIAIAIISTFLFYSTKHALMDRTFDQLTSLRTTKKLQVEEFFLDRRRDITFLSESEDTRKLLRFIQTDHNLPGNHSLKRKEQLITGIKNFMDKFNLLKNHFRSVFIIYPATGKMAGGTFTGYTLVGSIDSIGNLDKKLFPVNELSGRVMIQDECLDNITKTPIIYFGTGIKKDPGDTVQSEGLLIAELSIDAINQIMLNNNPESGLGQTGETYLVGSDYVLRSSSRFIPNSVLHTHVKTMAAIQAFINPEGHMITRDYRNIPVLSSYSKLEIPGLKWVILAEIDLSEASIPFLKMRTKTLIISSMITLAFFLLVFIIARRITQPIVRLRDAVINLGKGEYDIRLPITTRDEIGALTEAFNEMVFQIRQKTTELKVERTGRLRSMIDGEEMERQRLSRELHDGIGQAMIAVKLRLDSLLYENNAGMKKSIGELKNQFDQIIDEIRRMSNDLMPSVLEAFGIVTALSNLFTDTSENMGIKIIFKHDGDFDLLSKTIKTYIYRISQEAINNVVKHSEASEVVVNLKNEVNCLELSIRDNGKGFNPEKVYPEGGNGLYNIRERVSLMKGSTSIRSTPGQGTEIDIKIPIL
jgi:two-component system NarL family sensor kinase